ncbi:MAG: hypothetical protein P9M14_09030 [Candidatus Alcyoniella australis]|nr:hypothetical protein [Candidatus Alcyoniella australis]
MKRLLFLALVALLCLGVGLVISCSGGGDDDDGSDGGDDDDDDDLDENEPYIRVEGRIFDDDFLCYFDDPEGEPIYIGGAMGSYYMHFIFSGTYLENKSAWYVSEHIHIRYWCNGAQDYNPGEYSFSEAFFSISDTPGGETTNSYSFEGSGTFSWQIQSESEEYEVVLGHWEGCDEEIDYDYPEFKNSFEDNDACVTIDFLVPFRIDDGDFGGPDDDDSGDSDDDDSGDSDDDC